MIRVAVLLAFCSGISMAACKPSELPATESLSGNPVCISRVVPNIVTIVSESNCAPCIVLLHELLLRKKDASSGKQYQIVWIDADLATCAQSSQRFHALGKNICATRADADRKWSTLETPTAFWMDGKKLRTAKGNRRILNSLFLDFGKEGYQKN